MFLGRIHVYFVGHHLTNIKTFYKICNQKIYWAKTQNQGNLMISEKH